ncbi:hypothetical protein M407DRAFT_32743 [Tulasnella calospora MUT 4182]|uniref:Uncharacterized protein n=1 Tax=Tulasnella calospora MUT 4182 TaxID=1051891 RepID=A0A0C3Q3G1_9AGAM|nr:hypothetical protein M407DRAFT_32743 [Tulasnella calospora MUT 4182]
MTLADFIVWLHHFSDPEVPPENQFFFSAELRMAADAGAEIPTTVQAALKALPDSEDLNAKSAHKQRPQKGPTHTAAPNQVASKSRPTKSQGGQAVRASDSRKNAGKAKKQTQCPSDDSDESVEGEEIILPSSDELDDLSDVDLVAEARRGGRQSQRIKNKDKLKEQGSTGGGSISRQEDAVATAALGGSTGSGVVPGEGDAVATAVPGGSKAAVASRLEQQMQFLSSVSIMTPSRRQPSVFSFSPTLDRVDASTANRLVHSLVKAKLQLQNLPCPAFPCINKSTGLSAPKSVFDLLTLLLLLDHIFPNRPKIEHPPFRTTSMSVEAVDPTLVSAVSAQVWTPLNNPDLAIPMASTLNRICGQDVKYAKNTFETAVIFVRELLELLRRRNLLASERQVYMATRLFSILCRYIVFIGRHPSSARKVQPYINVIAEWGTVLVTVTYAIHTAQEIVPRHPRESLSGPLTQVTAVPALLSSFLDSLYQYIARCQYTLAHVVHGEFLFLDLSKPPCFSLSSPSNRWFCAVPNSEMETRLSKFFSTHLEEQPAVFCDMPIIGQMELLTVVCALHTWRAREMAEEEWFGWLESLRSSIIGHISSSDKGVVAEKEPASVLNNSQHKTFSYQNGQKQATLNAGDVSNGTPGHEAAVAQPQLPRLPTTTTGQVNAEGQDQPPTSPSPQPAKRKEPGPEDTNDAAPPLTDADDAMPDSSLGLQAGCWRPGDRAQVVINKKPRDVEFIKQDGALQMRDTETRKVLTDRHRNPKPLPEFCQHSLLYRLPPNAPQKSARFHLYSTDPPPPPDFNHPASWTPFLPSDEEIDAEKVRSQWETASSQGSSIKGTIIDNGVRRPTRQVKAPINPAGERVEVPGHFRRNAGKWKAT